MQVVFFPYYILVKATIRRHASLMIVYYNSGPKKSAGECMAAPKHFLRLV
jgi:hypothetical protein